MSINQKSEITGIAARCFWRWFIPTLQLALALPLFFYAMRVPAQTTSPLLTNAIDVISLPAEKASQSLKVLVTGVVTASDPTLKGRFFVQDATGGVFVDNVNGTHLKAGELVEISGITYAGAYAPTITAPQVRIKGTAPLPAAKPVSVEQLMSGAEDSQRIEASGIVRDARVDGSRMAVDLAAGGYRFRAYVDVPLGYQFEKLVGSQVLIRGTAAEAHNRSLRQLIIVEVYIPILSDLVIEKPEPADPFDRPIIQLNNLGQYRRDNSLGQRVHVRGVVTLQKNGESLFLQDDVGGLQIQSRQSAVCQPGDLVEAVGFPSFENYLPVLQDAVFRKLPKPSAPIQATPVTIDELQKVLHHAEYISLAGKLIERTVRQGSGSKHPLSYTTTVLVLQGSNFTFAAEANYASGQQDLAAIQIGSVLRVSGVCLTEIDGEGKLKSVQILLGNSDGIEVLQKPSWLTPQRLLIGFAIVFSGLIIFAGWTVMVSRKNSVLNFLIREREKAQLALQQANDQLEERVKARTEQLKFQITARKESELQFKAVLAERTRLAQELHDTVEQTLTGIAMELDTARKLYEKHPQDALAHLELSCDLMSRSQLEVRQSVWDLRRLVQDQFDIASALLETARQLTAGTEIDVKLESKGDIRALPEVVEENFLRIGREAIVNVLKHSQATTVNILLEFGPRLVALNIHDNGRGFVPQEAVGPDEGHFGLLGMSERVKRLGGEFSLTSAPGAGTTVRVEIVLEPVQETIAPDFVISQNSHEESRENSHPDS
ncbi:MAG TPA: histidine kinase [Verrucomicrobiae bacterium]|nr:histidine kinase [Verrucomicrobiae bacterium]